MVSRALTPTMIYKSVINRKSDKDLALRDLTVNKLLKLGWQYSQQSQLHVPVHYILKKTCSSEFFKDLKIAWVLWICAICGLWKTISACFFQISWEMHLQRMDSQCCICLQLWRFEKSLCSFINTGIYLYLKKLTCSTRIILV